MPIGILKDTPSRIYILSSTHGLDLGKLGFRTNIPLSIVLTPDIVQAINNRGTLVLYESEGYPLHIFGRLVTEILKSGINLNKVVMIGSASYKDPRIETHYINHLEEYYYSKIIRE